MSHTPRILIVSPVRDEAAYLGATIDSVVAGTLQPARWVIVDDGSSDATAAIAERAAREHPWIRLVRLPDRGSRAVDTGVVDAFYAGLETVDAGDYDFLCKLDGDVTVGPSYFECLMKYFEADPRLGAASGKVWCVENGSLSPERTRREMVSGAFKCYRRECFEDIGGLVRGPMWDAIDFHKARMKGWRTRSFDDEELVIRHHRRMGSSDRNIFVGRLRWGLGHFFMGTHPAYLLAVAAYRLFERPFVVGGACILLGYVLAWLRREPRYDDPEFRRCLRRWQLWKIKLAAEPPPQTECERSNVG